MWARSSKARKAALRRRRKQELLRRAWLDIGRLYWGLYVAPKQSGWLQ